MDEFLSNQAAKTIEIRQDDAKPMHLNGIRTLNKDRLT